MFKVLDLFSGIGGFSLGLERTGGFETIAFCEIDSYCQKVLAKHWPDIPIYDDVTKLDGKEFRGTVDVITGGFPCQDISVAGKQAGIEGERSGLWSEFARLIGEVRPAFAIVENVPMLLSGDRGGWFGKILGDLAEIGYDCEWHCIPASAIGAPHRRDRVWIVAYPASTGRQPFGRRGGKSDRRQANDVASRGKAVADASGDELRNQSGWRHGQSWANQAQLEHDGWWTTEPDVGRVAHGIPKRVDRLRCLGNAIVPQIATLIGEAILRQPEMQTP